MFAPRTSGPLSLRECVSAGIDAVMIMVLAQNPFIC